jgi:hypothetical protein
MSDKPEDYEVPQKLPEEPVKPKPAPMTQEEARMRLATIIAAAIWSDLRSRNGFMQVIKKLPKEAQSGVVHHWLETIDALLIKNLTYAPQTEQEKPSEMDRVSRQGESLPVSD